MPSDVLYPLLGAAAVVIVGFAIVMKGGSKFGWIAVAAGIVWAYYTLQPVIRQAGQPASGKGDYYNVPGKTK
jgi:hypothetical protein